MSKRRKEIIWLEWYADLGELGDEFFQAYMWIDCGFGLYPEQLIAMNDETQQTVNEYLEQYREEFYEDNDNFNPIYKCGDHERDIDYTFKMRKMSPAKIKKAVSKLTKEHEGTFCPECGYVYDDNKYYSVLLCDNCNRVRVGVSS